MTLEDYVRAWLGRQGRLAPNSIRAYRSVLVNHVLPAFGTLRIDAIPTVRIRAFLQAKLAAGKPRRSVQSYHAALSTVLTDALIDGLIVTNPAHGASRRLWPRRGPMVKGLAIEALHALLLAADLDRVGWFGAFCRILVRTGLRLGENLALQPHDVLAGSLRIERTYHGAGRFGPPKGGRSRIVQIDEATLGLLRARMLLGSPYLFTADNGRQPWSLTQCDLIMARVVGHAGLPEGVTLHSLRHTYATMLLDDGCDPVWLQRQLGHASIAMTCDLYGAGSHGRRPELLRGLERVEPQRHPIRSLGHSRPRVVSLQERRR